MCMVDDLERLKTTCNTACSAKEIGQLRSVLSQVHSMSHTLDNVERGQEKVLDLLLSAQEGKPIPKLLAINYDTN